MKKISLAFFLLVTVSAATSADLYAVRINSFTIQAETNGHVQILENGALKKKCTLSTPIASFLVSHDKSAIILGKNRYVPIPELLDCNEHNVIKTKTVPAIGTLTDINLTARIYVSVTIVATAPQFLCTATVASINSNKSLVRLQGANIQGMSLQSAQENAFECPDRSLISTDGRFVSVKGDIDCTESSYPGVWDLRQHKKVIFSDHEFSTEEINSRCKRLFFQD